MSKSQVKSQFGANAAEYATSAVHAKGASLARLVELAKPQPAWRVLDVATAAGHTALAFAPHVAHVVASDLTQEMLLQTQKLASERGIANLTTVEADAENLPFADASFDLVTCRIAAHHFPDIPAFLAQCHRVLKPLGCLALVDNIAPDELAMPADQNFTDAELRDAETAYNAFEKLRDPSHARALRQSEWQDLLAREGFAIEHAERLSKAMEFQPWAERMQKSPETREDLRASLTNSPPALRAFLQPRRQNGQLWFTLLEVVLIARRPGQRLEAGRDR